MLTLMGVPLSQPFRACAWLMAMKGLPYKVQVVLPGSKAVGGTRHPDHLQVVPGGTIPAIRDGEFVLSESMAIMQYLCTKHGWHDMYPQSLEERARVDQLLHWSHRTLREATLGYLFPLFRPGDAKMPPFVYEASQKSFAYSLKALENGYLKDTPFVCGDHPTIADIAAYTEVGQLEPTRIFDFTPFPKVSAWLERMRALPAHDACFAALFTLGDLRGKKALTPPELKEATMSGLRALKPMSKL